MYHQNKRFIFTFFCVNLSKVLEGTSGRQKMFSVEKMFKDVFPAARVTENGKVPDMSLVNKAQVLWVNGIHFYC